MSTMQRLTLIGMYNYDPSLFDTVELPEGYDKDVFINSMLLEHGEKCVLYTDVDFMKFSLGAVSRKWSLELQKIYNALTAEYNPTYNYDRYEVIGDTVKKTFGEKTTADYNDDNTKNLEDKRTADLKDKTTFNSSDTTEQLEDTTVENQVSAYNASTYQPKDKTTTDNGKSKVSYDGTNTLDTTGTDTIATTGTDKRNIKGTLSDKSGGEDVTNKHNAHIYGNIGVTTATKMIDEILVQRMTKNLYELACRIFANELLINLY